MLLVSCEELRKTTRKTEKGHGNKITGETKPVLNLNFICFSRWLSGYDLEYLLQ